MVGLAINGRRVNELPLSVHVVNVGCLRVGRVGDINSLSFRGARHRLRGDVRLTSRVARHAWRGVVCPFARGPIAVLNHPGHLIDIRCPG